MSERSSQLAEAAVRRGWHYAASGEGLGLAARWKWPVRFDHPFRYGSRGAGPTRRDPFVDVVMGVTPAGHDFWAFWTPHLRTVAATGQGGLPNMPTRCIAFVDTARSLPTVSVVSRESLARPLMSKLDQWAARRAAPQAGEHGELLRRLDGWPVGSDDFQRHYKVEADDAHAAEWLLNPETQGRLLADPSVSLTSIGADIVAWCDRGLGGEGFDVMLVEALVDVLDTIELPP